MNHRITARCVTSLLVVVMVSACTDEAEPPETTHRGTVTIYSSLPLQGDSKPQSEDIVHAMRMALEEHGSEAAGYSIAYVSLDDATSEFGSWHPDMVAANADTAARDPNAIAYVGEFNSPASAISLPIINGAGILQVSPSNTNVGLTRADGALEGEPDKYYPTGERHYGRVVPADHVQAGALVSYMRNNDCQSVFILNDGNLGYGKPIADQVERNALDQGLDVLGNESIDLEAKDFNEAANEVKESSADCFFFGGFTMNRAVEVTKAVAATVPGIKMFFPDGCAESTFTEHVDELSEQLFITNPTLGPESYPPLGQEFLEDFEAEHGRPPEPYAIYGYEAMSIVLDAIERAGEAASPTTEGRQAVIDAFFQTTDRESVLGTYDIDPYGDTTLAAYGAYGVEDGLLVFDSVIDVVVAEPTKGPELAPVSEGPTELEGTWRGRKVTYAMLKRATSAKEARTVFDANRSKSHLVTTLELTDDSWQVSVSVDGGPEEPAQVGTFSIEGDLIHMEEHGFDTSYTYRFEIREDTLRIGLVESDALPDPELGISDDVFQLAHFMAPFERVN